MNPLTDRPATRPVSAGVETMPWRRFKVVLRDGLRSAAVWAVRGWRLLTPRRRVGAAEPQQVAVIGFFDSISGLGVAVRRLVAALDTRVTTAVSISALSPSPRLPVVVPTGAGATAGLAVAEHDVVLHFYNPDVFAHVVRLLGLRAFSRRAVSVAMVHWESGRLPADWRRVLACYDHLCAPSRFTAEAIATSTGRQVAVLPLCVPEYPVRERPAGAGRFEFLTVFDHLSCLDRKNPAGVVAAFQMAQERLSRMTACRLRVKCLAATPRAVVDDLRELAGDSDVIVDNTTLDAAAMDRLWEGCDCYVSLHRSEGFGLPVAEAMARGIPVITTRQGGVLDFAGEATVFFVHGGPSRATIGGPSPYADRSGWIDPDPGLAAAAMVQVVRDYGAARLRAAEGRRDVRRSHGAETVRTRWHELLLQWR